MNFKIKDTAANITMKLGSDAVLNASTFGKRWQNGVLDLVGIPNDEATADHYELQSSGEVEFQNFARANPQAMQATPGKQMGWPRFFHEIREMARSHEVRVYDAACGFGGLVDEFFADPIPQGLIYLGADIHGSLADIRRPDGARAGQVTLVWWDIGERLPVLEPFDVVVCRASIHHTRQPDRTFDNLASVLKPGGRIAISAYARKGNLCEAVDDGLRTVIAPMAPRDAMSVGRELARFGQALQRSGAHITIDKDMPWLRVKADEYPLQALICDHLLKCCWNDSFDEDYSIVVNYDWYHPIYVYRYFINDIEVWFVKNCIFSQH